MAKTKFSGIKLTTTEQQPGFEYIGTDNASLTYESEIFCEPRLPVDLTDGKDGDLWIRTPALGYPAGGADVGLFLKVAGVWTTVSSSTPIKVALLAAQVGTAAVVFPALFAYGKIEYTITQPNFANSKSGKIVFQTDSTALGTTHSHEFQDNGVGTDISLTIVHTGAQLELQYDSTLAGELTYTINGWN